jgi:nucleotide-binding universal stress UspA family protein
MAQKILLALDGSDNAIRAVKYLGKMTEGCKGFHITLFHVMAIPPELMEHGGPGKGDSRNQDRGRQLADELQEKQEKWRQEGQEAAEREIFAPAKRILESTGSLGALLTIATKIVVKAHPDVAREIIRETEAGGYGTIVLGKRGRGMIKDFLFGGVTCKVIHNVEGCTLWVVE